MTRINQKNGINTHKLKNVVIKRPKAQSSAVDALGADPTSSATPAAAEKDAISNGHGK